MAAYVLFIREKTIGQREMDTYAEKVPATLLRVPIQMLSAYGRLKVFEGETPEGVVLFALPTLRMPGFGTTATYTSGSPSTGLQVRSIEDLL
ncbi:DUF1330 domain-containing protein [Pectobacterium versatile]|nr:DUF1330 domain-containing protein [Pectobacterium versatile]